MDVVTLDAETFYDRSKGYSLRNSNKGLTTEDYITDPRFQLILFSAKINDGPTEWVSFTHMDDWGQWLTALRLPERALCCQNTRFDGSILAIRFGILPAFYMDTLAMATPWFKPLLKSLSLGKICEHLGLGSKGDDIIRAEGKRLEDFSPEDLQSYARYCMNDTDLTRKLYRRLRREYYDNVPRVPDIAPNGAPWMGPARKELRNIDQTIRMYTQPRLHLDRDVYTANLKRVQERKANQLAEMELQGITKKMLASNDQFAKLLRDRGIEPPLKESPAWRKKPEGERDPAKRYTYAFAKTDPEFIELQEDLEGDEELELIFGARTEVKSTQEERRTEKFIEKSKHTVCRVAAGYYGAHTGRYTGQDGENLLNLPNVGEYKDAQGDRAYKSHLRFGLVAPPGHKVISIDKSQIEARLVATLCGQDDLVQEFGQGLCVYSSCAAGLFGREVSKALAKIHVQAKKDRDAGKIIILGCGYGMGWIKFKRSNRSKGLILSDAEAMQYVTYYRDRYPMIPIGWRQLTWHLERLVMDRQETNFGPVKFAWLDKKDAAIILPNGMELLYPGLKLVKNDTGQMDIVCRHARDKFPRRLWGGVIMENLGQSLARVMIVDDMDAIFTELGYRTSLQVYDEIIVVVPDHDVNRVVAGAMQIMRRRPWWLPDLPVDCEANVGLSYGTV